MAWATSSWLVFPPGLWGIYAAVQYTLAAYQCNSVFKHTSQHGNANTMSQVQLCTSSRESPIPAKTDFADPVQDHMLLVIIDAHFMLSAYHYISLLLPGLPPIPLQIHKILQACDKNPTDAHKLQYDKFNPFTFVHYYCNLLFRIPLLPLQRKTIWEMPTLQNKLLTRIQGNCMSESIVYKPEGISNPSKDRFCRSCAGSHALVIIDAHFMLSVYHYVSLLLPGLPPILLQIHKILQACDKNPTDVHKLQYDEFNPFTLCGNSCKPIYRWSILWNWQSVSVLALPVCTPCKASATMPAIITGQLLPLLTKRRLRSFIPIVLVMFSVM